MNAEYMKKAIKIAAESKEDLPVGAVIVKEGKIIAAAHNLKEKKKDVTAHAEIEAIRMASKTLKDWRMSDCDIYVTLEPCPMCASAIIQARFKNLFFGAYDTMYGAFTTLPQLQSILNSKVNIKGGIMEYECERIIKEYFEKLR